MHPNTRSMQYPIAAPAPAAPANSWVFPGSCLDPRIQRLNFNGETGTATLYYMGESANVAHSSGAGTVQAALNAAWGPLGVAVTVAGPAGNLLITFTDQDDGLLPDWIYPNFSALSGSGADAVITSDICWLGAAKICSLHTDADWGSGAPPTIEVVNARVAATNKPLYTFTNTAVQGQYPPSPRIAPPPSATIKAPLVFECFLLQDDPASGLVLPVYKQAAADHEHHEIGAVCPDAALVHVTTVGNQTAGRDINVAYAPMGMGAQRLKNDAAGQQATRTTPILQ